MHVPGICIGTGVVPCAMLTLRIIPHITFVMTLEVCRLAEDLTFSGVLLL